MGFQKSERVIELDARPKAVMQEHIYPREHEYEEFTLNPENLWQTPPWFDGLRDAAKEAGLWNLFLPKEYQPWSPGLTNLEIANHTRLNVPMRIMKRLSGLTKTGEVR